MKIVITLPIIDQFKNAFEKLILFNRQNYNVFSKIIKILLVN